MRVCVYGLGHLGQVTAVCLAARGFSVVGFDPDWRHIDHLAHSETSLPEPGIDDLLSAGLQSGRLTFTEFPADALEGVDILWVTFDTPVDSDNQADVDYVRQRLEDVRPYLTPNQMVLISSQVPVGFTAKLQKDWPGLQIAVSPENLRRGKAIECFNDPGRVVIGGVVDERLVQLFAPFCTVLLWMSLESAEMVKHTLNGFLATSISFANEIGRLCEQVGADQKDVERGLRSDPRIGQFAYVKPGNAITGGTLLRDVEYLRTLAQEHRLHAPVIDAIPASNQITAAA